MRAREDQPDVSSITMRVLAIDPALEACSAAVLDTDQGGILASESIPMVRGHAEALMPLVARGMSEARLGFPRLAAYAAPYIAADDVTPLLTAIDARNDQVYMQLFGPGGRTLIQPRIASLRDAIRAAATGPARLVGSRAA